MSEDGSPRSDPHSASVPSALLPWQKKPRFSWTTAYETTFFKSLCHSVQLGLRESMSFKPEAWNRALAVLREQGAFPTKAHLINKTDNARKKFRLWRGLIENPMFTYDPTTRLITGSEEAWAAHLEKEPLARAIRDRPFENAEYLEILFPDVVGTAGQPKRVTKPRRKGADGLSPNSGGSSETTPSASIMRLANGPGAAPTPTPVRIGSTAGMPPGVASTPIPLPSGTPQGRQQQAGAAAAQAAGAAGVQQMRMGAAAQNAQTTGAGQPSVSMIAPPPPPGTLRQQGGAAGRVGGAASVAALTPPDETSSNSNSNNGSSSSSSSSGNAAAAHGQKRLAPGSEAPAAAAAASKRRRTEGSINNGRNRAEQQPGGAAPASAAGLGGPSNSGGGGGVGGIGGLPAAGRALASSSEPLLAAPPPYAVGGGGAGGGRPGPGGPPSMGGPRMDGIAVLLSEVLSKYASAATLASTTRWPEQAMDIFFQEFSDEDMDLQLRVAEKILTDNSKAVMFCKMPAALRKHWVKRLREAISRQGN